MHFLINECSFIGQAKYDEDADNLMNVLLEIIKELEPIRGKEPILTHSCFFGCNISQTINVSKWLYKKAKSSIGEKQENSRLLLIKLKNNGPFIDEILDEKVDYYECQFNNQDVLGSSLAGAAYLKGTLISLQNAPDFLVEYIHVKFSIDSDVSEDREILNLTNVTQAKKLRPKYIPSPKHAPGGWGTLMDLTDEEAQQVLDTGIVSGRQIYGYFNGQFYEFQSDNVDGFHGYPVSENEVPFNVIKQIKNEEF
ncbi:MAG: hypothetical protein RIM23_28085 [Coleofasciculus sp. G3-WIS-01]|uniref:hypothetical protein n=1 Tax=Coleofasciculus sp. G3-WIS-01 TaxID=3069528 RepID=UPI00330503F3